MKKRYTEEQIIATLKEHAAGGRGPQRLGASEAVQVIFTNAKQKLCAHLHLK